MTGKWIISVVSFQAFAPHEREYNLDPGVQGRLTKETFGVKNDKHARQSFKASINHPSMRSFSIRANPEYPRHEEES